MTLSPASPGEVADAVRSRSRLLPRGGGSKTALSSPQDGVEILDLSALRGVVEYVPQEFTLTARAGTPVSEIEALLAKNDQYLPFEPLLAGRGATLGGSVAAGAAGPGRFRFGGLRDFLLGVNFVDGQGRTIRGGGKVVKNAAGFDFPKLFVGSLGRLGVLLELTFKVFPRPQARATLKAEFRALGPALEALLDLLSSPLELECLDLEAPSTLWLRMGGLASALPQRLDRLRQHLQGAQTEVVEDEDRRWQKLRDLTWLPEGCSLLKIPLTPQRIPALEQKLAKTRSRRYYSAGGQQLWLAWSGDEEALQSTLVGEGLQGVSFLGLPKRRLWGDLAGTAFLGRVKNTFDPLVRFPDF